MDLGRGLKRSSAAFPAFVALVLLGAVAPAAGAEDLAASFYRPGIVNVIKLELAPAAIKALETDPEEYQPGTFSMAETNGTPTGIGEYSAPIEAQIRLKGSGSFKPLGHKSAFKIKFGRGPLRSGAGWRPGIWKRWPSTAAG
ncbi:MAG: hypothetical protein QOF06_2669 [Solirubrobacterales bacterium]|jgi:hypothetical protein|nr:hypothetical protein [Solirubrobacterales bacterium]